MASKLYDLFWAFPTPREHRSNPVQLTQPNVLALPNVGIPAMILYPALLTPAIVVDKDNVELILAFNQGELNKLKADSDAEKETALKKLINRQLKVQPVLSRLKWYSPSPLFPGGDWAQKIQLEKFNGSMTDQLRTKGKKFKGFMHQAGADLYLKNKVKFDQIYLASIDPGMLASALAPNKRYVHLLQGDKVEILKRDKVQESIVHEAVKVDYGSFDSDYKGQYGFKVQGADARVGDVDWKEPVQSYHPVFYFQKLDYANVGHMADIHINSRQQILSRSKAKVADHADIKTVGEMMNICSLDTKELFDKFGADPDVDVVIIGGDLVDFIFNAIVKDVDASPAPGAIWDMVDMDRQKNYKDNVDFLAFYSILLDFYRTYSKPAYVVTGNHDQYYEPYGISPRVQMGVTEKKANEGIPWDHNLTIYEAVLSFGPTYARLLTGLNTQGRPESSFWKEKVAWFHQVLTPFSDYTMELPNQHFVALGWGGNENLLSIFTKRDQGVGHLPRADEAMSEKQYNLLTSVTGKNDGKKVILTTHFTFVSYKEPIANRDALSDRWGNKNNEGDVYYTAAWYSSRDFSLADMGTFHLHREDLYSKMFAAQRRVQVVLTGHSHRRAFYTIRRDDRPTIGNNSVKTGFHDFPIFQRGKPVSVVAHGGAVYQITPQDQQEPWIILSDSGGSVPRVNFAGEFKGWGSDPPAGTKIVFDAGLGGGVKSIDAVRVSHQRAKPRFAVAMDYLDVMEGAVIKTFQCAEFIEDAEYGDGWEYHFSFEFKSDLYDAAKYGLTIDTMDLYYPGARGVSKVSFELESSDQKNWKLPAKDAKEFRRRVTRAPKRTLILALKISSSLQHLQRYDFSTPWTFEVDMTRKSWPKLINFKAQMAHWYILERKDDWREKPDLDKRRAAPGFG